MSIMILKGKEAFSEFRLKNIYNIIRKDLPEISKIEAHVFYFIDLKGSRPEGEELSRIIQILDAEIFNSKIDNNSFFVTPRKGTISPWCSKATDIFHNCGIEGILRVEKGICYKLTGNTKPLNLKLPVFLSFYDRMIEGIYTDISDIFDHKEPAPFYSPDILKEGIDALINLNKSMGLALSDEEIKYLYEVFKDLNRNPTDVELMMFSQVNSEHCRHKIFNADWIIDQKKMDKSLFEMIKNTHKLHPQGTLVAYKDNSGVMEGFEGEWFESDFNDKKYSYKKETLDILMKVETHNHPTAISPYPGAATGVGGEIRDEGATGTGSKSKCGLSAFMVSNLKVPGFLMPWEKDFAEFPGHLATPYQIMIDGPLGGARFGNEFGRPQLCGIFRTFEQKIQDKYYGYHKPIMVAGGMGNIKRKHIEKKDIPEKALIIQIGGPALRIGLGGGAASSMDSGSNALHLDFDSVQRDNAEMQRRCQEVINSCISLEDKNPILSIHDIGAGGLSNGTPELVSETGGKFNLRAIHNEEKSMSPMEIWCCEAQERYVLAIEQKDLKIFDDICKRERCPYAVFGEATGDKHLTLEDSHFKNKPIDIDLKVILGKPPKMLRDVKSKIKEFHDFDLSNIDLEQALHKVLRLPAVANKTFLITIADRSITGLVARDQMVGPYQTPISDAAVTAASFKSFSGEAMSMGERTPIAIINAPASGRMAIGEAITNIAGTFIGDIGKIKMSANWMCACGEEGEDAKLFETVKAVGMELCPALGISIPVGKDSLSMRTGWNQKNGTKEKVMSPLSLVISAFAPVSDIRKTVTAELKNAPSKLFLIDIGANKNRIGASCLLQTHNDIGKITPDIDNPELLVNFFNAMQELVKNEFISAYHDRADGGLIVTVLEMCFGGHIGAALNFNVADSSELIKLLFTEELGAVIQVEETLISKVKAVFSKFGLNDVVNEIGSLNNSKQFILTNNNKEILKKNILELKSVWSELTYKMQSSRDNPICAKEEFDSILDAENPGMQYKFSFETNKTVNIKTHKPKVAILREQGINGHIEMAAAFDLAGFESIDVHMTDLLNNKINFNDFKGFVACGGFSYGDVLGAGSGWARSILFNERLKDNIVSFFNRSDTFTLGICNGCQMLSQLKNIIPGASHWPYFKKNKSEQFEARFVSVEILPTPSVLLNGMQGAIIGVPVAHGEGFCEFESPASIKALKDNNLIGVRYVDNFGKPTEKYPYNPNSSFEGITGLTTLDGRVTIMMPHPERVFRTVQLSYRHQDMKSEMGPWFKLFTNARDFAG